MNEEAKQLIDAQGIFQRDVEIVLKELREMLFAKNRKYGDAALNPNRTFASSQASELINVRIDDKLSRIKNRQTDEDEDPEWDIMGYLVLKRIALKRERISKELQQKEEAYANSIVGANPDPQLAPEPYMGKLCKNRPYERCPTPEGCMAGRRCVVDGQPFTYLK